MFLRQFLDDRCGCASYLVACRATGEAAVIDPGVATEQYERVLVERGFRLRFAIDTHVHADHVSGARALAQNHDAEVCLHRAAKVTYAFRPLSDGNTVEVGRLRLRAMHTPGHRPELISLLLVDPERGPDPLAVMTGDSLLVGDAGRPDFGGGDAEAQHRSLARLLALPDWVQVFPGHFEGPCGAGMTGAASSTIGYERRYNPLARLDRDSFVARLSAAIPPRPLNQTAIEATNRGLAEMPWAMLTTSPAVRQVSVHELDRSRHGALLIDVREPEEFARGHLPGALNVPQADLAGWQRGAPRDRDLLLICQSGRRSLQAAQFLVQCGIERVASVAGGTQAWADAGKPVALGSATEPVRRAQPATPSGARTTPMGPVAVR